MKFNFLVIIFSGISISFVAAIILILPASAKQLVERNMEYFLTIPPISVASYILVFKYLEKFQNNAPTMRELFSKILFGSIAAFVFFFLMAIITGFLFKLYIVYTKWRIVLFNFTVLCDIKTFPLSRWETLLPGWELYNRVCSYGDAQGVTFLSLVWRKWLLHRAWIRYPIPDENANVWMVQELVSGAIEKTNGNVTCADALNQPDHWRE